MFVFVADRLAVLNVGFPLLGFDSNISLFDSDPSRVITLGETLVDVGSAPLALITAEATTCFPLLSSPDLIWTSEDQIHVVPGPSFDLTNEVVTAGPAIPGVRVDRLAANDLDGDGCNDLLVVMRSSDLDGSDRRGLVLLYFGFGAGAFTLPFLILDDPDFQIRDLRFVDLDADGEQDVVMARRTTGANSIAILYGDPGFGIFDPPVFLSSTRCCDATGLDVADVDGDGNLDIVLGNSGEPLGDTASAPGLEVFFGAGSRTFDATVLHQEPARDVLVANIDADSDLEILYLTSRLLKVFDPFSP